MVDKVIVTLICGGREFDMEIPANAKVEQIKPAISEALSRKGIRLEEPFNLISNGYTLKDPDTLYEAGVWDGSYVKAV